MDLISYRGPGVAGGVSSGLGSAWRDGEASNSRWWHVSKNTLQVLSPKDKMAKFIFLLPETLINGHYRYCNEFLWPVFHDLPEFASYHAEQENAYQVFNRLMAEYIDFESSAHQDFFIQDYQLCLLPNWMAMFGHASGVFWHIPWPRNVREDHVEAIKNIARGLLASSALGFHSYEYADNFANFVREHMPEYAVDDENKVIHQVVPSTMQRRDILGLRRRGAFIMRPDLIPEAQYQSKTRVIIRPLGIDADFWMDAAKSPASSLNLSADLLKMAESNFVLSVDRADYTKSVLDRMLVVDRYFESHPEAVGKVTFAQVCGRTRSGLDAFDNYWHACRAVWSATNNRWRQGDWEPVKWVENPLSAKELAYLYARADAMLVNPVRDGLNLTAKEFVACRQDNAGVLLLSPGAGVWHELGGGALPAPPREVARTVRSVERALEMSAVEKDVRQQLMFSQIKDNTLSDWWQYFSRLKLHLHEELAPVAESNVSELLQRKAS